AYVRQLGEQDGKLMASIGINVNLAPVVDVQGIPDGQTYMSYRMFGWTPDKVALNAGAYLDGEQSGMQVVGTLKHFPGLGSVSSDPHAAAAVNNHTLDQLNQIDWAPYRALFAMGRVDLIMTSHILVPAVDPSRPTTISQPVTTGILRQKLGFNGVIITDDIYMQSLSAYYSFAQRVTGAVLAGNDLIASVFTLDATAAAERIIHDDVTAGTITKERIDESVRRILLLKLRYGVIKMPVKPAA
ncbi:MAG TPA: glycoside hydrolase family 3 N-terminal domain-containing protein, partial [Ktedonobacterales bacterium]